jgi:hypothetical protein
MNIFRFQYQNDILIVFLIFFSGKLRNGSVQEAFYQHFKTITLYFLFKRGLIF